MTTPGSDEDRDLELDDEALRPMRAVWLSMRDEEPPSGGLAELMAAARAQAAAMQPKEPWWQRMLAVMRRPPVLALATVTVLLGGTVLIGSRREQMEAVPSVEQRELARSGETAASAGAGAGARDEGGGSAGAVRAGAERGLEDSKLSEGTMGTGTAAAAGAAGNGERGPGQAPAKEPAGAAAGSAGGAGGAYGAAGPPSGAAVRSGGGGAPRAQGGQSGQKPGADEKVTGEVVAEGEADGAGGAGVAGVETKPPVAPADGEQSNAQPPADLKKAIVAGRTPPVADPSRTDKPDKNEKTKDKVAGSADRGPTRAPSPPPPSMAPKGGAQSAPKQDLQIADDAESISVTGNEPQLSGTAPRTRTTTTDANRNEGSAPGNRRATLEQLAKQAETAAARGDCAAARAMADRIRKLDATFHKERVQSNATVKRCLK